jgi:hypothetical protein
MIAPHKCFLTIYLLIAPFVEQIVNLRKKKIPKLEKIDGIRSTASLYHAMVGAAATVHMTTL